MCTGSHWQPTNRFNAIMINVSPATFAMSHKDDLPDMRPHEANCHTLRQGSRALHRPFEVIRYLQCILSLQSRTPGTTCISTICSHLPTRWPCWRYAGRNMIWKRQDTQKERVNKLLLRKTRKRAKWQWTKARSLALSGAGMVKKPRIVRPSLTS
jgi:hypothetical protein